MLVNLAALDYERNPNIVTINREGRDIFLECCTEISKEKIVWYVNEVLFNILKIALKNIYIGGGTTASQLNEVATCQKFYYDKETQFIVNQSVNKFYTWFLFKIDVRPQGAQFLLEISATFLTTLALKLVSS